MCEYGVLLLNIFQAPLPSGEVLARPYFASFFIPAAAAFLVLFHFALNLPVIDDCQAILEISLHFLKLNTTNEKFFCSMAAQHADYKLVTQQLLLIAQLRSIYQINFTFFDLGGQSSAVADAAGALEDLLSRSGYAWPSGLVPSHPVDLFAPNYAQTVDFAISGIQVIAVLPLGELLSIYSGAR